MKKILRIPAFWLVFILLISTVPITTASEIQPRFTYVNDLTTSISIDSNGNAICKGKVITTTPTTVKIVCKLQKYVNQSWVTLTQWSKEGTSQANISATYAVTSGSVYRVYTVGIVLDSIGNELETATLADAEYYP